MPSIASLWELNEVQRLLRKQKDNGAWPYCSARRSYLRAADNYDQLETYRIVGELVEKFGITRDHSAMRQAADYLFSHQTNEGDFRGIYGTQYSPNYSAAIMELLINAGYAHDERIAQGFRWLLHIRQRDAGWAISLRTAGAKLDSLVMKGDTIQPDRSKPFFHLVTGVVVRAFAAHERRRASSAAMPRTLLPSRFFRRDVYPDRSAAFFGRSSHIRSGLLTFYRRLTRCRGSVLTCETRESNKRSLGSSPSSDQAGAGN